MKKVRCNLCDWETDHDNVNGKTRHVDWHKYARVQKRNTTQGDVIWIWTNVIFVEKSRIVKYLEDTCKLQSVKNVRRRKLVNQKEFFDLISKSLDDFYEVNNTLPDNLYDQLKALNDGIYKIEKIYDELKKEIESWT